MLLMNCLQALAKALTVGRTGIHWKTQSHLELVARGTTAPVEELVSLLGSS